MNEQLTDRNQRTEWYRDSRFGLFMHWGLYSVLGIDEWIRSINQMPEKDYVHLMDQFTAENYHPEEWAKMAKAAGMKYAILTAKHHDGFCLFDSQLTDYKSTNAAAGRDLVREFLDAFRAEGIKVGLYYSLLDWHHPDYPHYGDRNHPERNNPAYKDVPYNFQNYLDYMHGQIKELLTNYGQIDVMWFDFSYENMAGDTWGADQIMDLIHQYQPQMIIDNRLEGAGNKVGSIMTQHPKRYAGDFASPEQVIPPYPIVNEMGEPVPWESCITINKHWCYNPADLHYKPAKLLVRTLVDCVSKSGNLLLNIGPTPKGEFPVQAQEILQEIGVWMKVNHESIYGNHVAEIAKPDWGRYTQKGNTLYAHIYEESISALEIRGLQGRIKRMTLLADGTEIVPTKHWTLSAYPDVDYFFLHQSATDSYPLPDPIDTVVKIELKPQE